MYKKIKTIETTLSINDSREGETLEQKMERIISNKEPITDGAPQIFTEREEGVLAGYNPRSDRFDIALDAMDTVSKTHEARREERIKSKKEKKEEVPIIKLEQEPAKQEPTQGTT